MEIQDENDDESFIYDSMNVLDMKTPDEECPQFETCSVNACPLHPDYAYLETIDGDKESECNAFRSTRENIASRYPGILSNNGLLDADLTRDKRSRKGKARWEALSDEEKAQRLIKLAAMREKRHI